VEGRDGWLSAKGAAAYDEAVTVVEADWGPFFVDSNTPATMQAGKTQQVKVILKNIGPRPWARGDFRLGYHWHYWDGLEALWEGKQTSLQTEVAPGAAITLEAEVQAPPQDGAYLLVWDLWQRDSGYLSSLDQAQGKNLLVAPVRVGGGPLRFVDLSQQVNVVAATTDGRRNFGDFDGRGRSLAAELLPPDAADPGGTSYPSGYYGPVSQAQLTGFARISFVFPAKKGGTSGAVACAGQEIALPKERLKFLHLLGATTGEQAEAAEFVLVYADGSQEAHTISLESWLRAPGQPEEAGIRVTHIHDLQADLPGQPGYLHHYSIPLDRSKEAASLKLPQNGRIKLVAITAETGP